MRVPRAQEDLPTRPYDRWLSPEGDETAQFHRLPGGYLVRFADSADFLIDAASLTVECFPASADAKDQSLTLFHNAIEPILGNYRGELHLHGSAVRLDGWAIGFLGHSRRGKTTLAGAFARAGHAFLTEDVLTLERHGPEFTALSSRAELRVFGDSAAHLTDCRDQSGDNDKQALAASPVLPHWAAPTPLAALFVLGPGACTQVQIAPLAQAEAVTRLIRQSFILDVEDRVRLRAHFDRIATLGETVNCYMLDYPRRYAELPLVIGAIEQLMTENERCQRQ